MKSLISVLLLIAAVFSLAACGSDYAPVPSTEEESRTLMTFELEGEKYELKYELYRALFLNHSTAYDGGDKSFWSKPESAGAKAELEEKIISLALDIFAALHLSKKTGYDPYSFDADDRIEEYIKESVEGGSVEGFEGDYDAYLESLKQMNLNYSVQALLYRYAIAHDKVIAYYRGTDDMDNPTPDMQAGALEYTEDDVRAFYNGEDSARVSIIVFNAAYITRDEVQKRRDKIASYATEDSALGYAVQFTDPMGDPEEILEGTVVGKNSLDRAFYSEVASSVFSLSEGETGDVLTVNSENRTEYWIVYKMAKSNAHLDENLAEIEDVYVYNRIGEITEGVKASLLASVKYTADYEALNLSEIKMN